MKEENIIRQILKNEITWIFAIIGCGWTFVTTVILPLNTIQQQLVQIQQNQASNINFQKQIQLTTNDFNSRISVLEAEIKNK